MTIVILYSTHTWNHFPIREVGGLLAIVSGAGLLLVVALDVRQMIIRSQYAPPVPPIQP